ncbi:MAG: VWA domain-containing protein, partial [Gammaproteobacteria bacterium]|nr:VWA domain-containing protein [Gammaproteobacteria bacterium]
MRNALFVFLSALVCGAASGDVEQLSDASRLSQGDVQIEIQSPSTDYDAAEGETTVEVEGIASAIGGVRYLDMMFVMDTSQSLRSTDPKDYRSAGAVGLVRNLSPKSDIKIGVVSFDNKGELAQALTSDRNLVAEALRNLPRSGSTNLAAGIQTALAELELNGRPGSSRVIMLFTDGMSNEKKAYDAAVRSHAKGAAIQTLLLGSSKKGGSILDTIAWATGGSFLQVSDPAKLPQAFLDLRTTGIESVTLSVNGSEPVPAQLAGGTFAGNVPL